MTRAFDAGEVQGETRRDKDGRRKVLVTGAAGRIGSFFSEHRHEQYSLRLTDLPSVDQEVRSRLEQWGEFIPADLTDLEASKPLFEGIDTVVHLAANPSPKATWDKLLPQNIITTYNAFAAARAAGCRRVVFASSIHAVSGYPSDVQVKASEPVNPGDLYGVTKCFGEALGRYMAGREGVSSIAIRIGAYQPIEKARTIKAIGFLDAFVSRRDLTQLISKAIDVENIRFAIVQGLSDNRFKSMDISDARELLGYEPQDDLTEEQPDLNDLELNERVSSHANEDPENSGMRKDVT